MKIYKREQTPIEAAYKQGLVSIWWYTDNEEFWDVSCTLDEAVESYGYLQVSLKDNHLNLWRKVVNEHVPENEVTKVADKGYKSIERGRVIFNIRTQAYEIICSKALCDDPKFRQNCIDYFGLFGNRYSFEALNHYGKQEFTGNPTLDSLYYEDGLY